MWGKDISFTTFANCKMRKMDDMFAMPRSFPPGTYHARLYLNKQGRRWYLKENDGYGLLEEELVRAGGFVKRSRHHIEVKSLDQVV